MQTKWFFLVALLLSSFFSRAQGLVLEFEKWSPIYPSGEFHWNSSYSYISIMGDKLYWGLGELNDKFTVDDIKVEEHEITLSGMHSKGGKIELKINKTENTALIYYSDQPIYILRRIVKDKDPCKITLNQPKL